MNKIKFLGTAGARFVVTKQLRASGGMWLNLDDTNVIIDPGPGSLVNCLSSRPKLNPMDLDGIILTHRHIDHSNDVNIMIEAMTNGGFKKKGVLFCPRDALDNDSVVLEYMLNKLDRLEILKENTQYKLKNITFSTSPKLKHGVETYGINLLTKNNSISLVTDTEFFKGIEKYFPGKILIINVVKIDDIKGVPHLSLNDAKKIIEKNRPKLSILTHFGMTMIKAKPWEIADNLTKELNLEVIAARDGMQIDVDNYI